MATKARFWLARFWGARFFAATGGAVAAVARRYNAMMVTVGRMMNR